jgi:hypothetical protein
MMPPESQLPFAQRIDPSWSAERVRRMLTDEPGPGMGSPFSNADAELFLRACGLKSPPLKLDEADAQLLERMWRWCESQT